ncbi:hypothetical protein LCGC14_0775180 [marine sediment metagenome]|uniref:Uncharacterized protein n=1 Tax=marine sediment metagenome TaxID=412755 RepID=A0A0F9Q1D7_9ZZZZ
MSEEMYLRVIKNGKQTVLIRNRGDSKIKLDYTSNYRKPYYESAAEIIIETNCKKKNNIVKEILIKTN